MVTREAVVDMLGYEELKDGITEEFQPLIVTPA